MEGEVAVKAYWIAAGVGVLVAVIGVVLWMVSDKQFGVILILSGMTIAALGVVMRLVEWAMNKGKRSASV